MRSVGLRVLSPLALFVLALALVAASCGSPGGAVGVPHASEAPTAAAGSEAERGHGLASSAESIVVAAPIDGALAVPAAVLVAAPATASDPTDSIVRPDLGGGYVVTGTTPHRLVLFTFDDGPHPVHTPRMLDELDRAGIRAVFFVVARRLARTDGPFADVDDVLREVARRGHVIGSHTRDHEILTRLSPAEVEVQIVGAEALIEGAIGARPWLFRPPGGMHDEALDGYLAGRGYTEFLWAVAAEDWLTRDPDVVFRNFRRVMVNRERRGTPGGVVVLHDTHPWTVEAFPRIVAWIDERNCELLESGEELYDIVEDPRFFVVPRPTGASTSTGAPPIVLEPDVLAERQARARLRAESRCVH